MVLSHDSGMKYRQLVLNALIRHFTQSTGGLQSPELGKFVRGERVIIYMTRVLPR